MRTDPRPPAASRANGVRARWIFKAPNCRSTIAILQKPLKQVLALGDLISPLKDLQISIERNTVGAAPRSAPEFSLGQPRLQQSGHGGDLSGPLLPEHARERVGSFLACAFHLKNPSLEIYILVSQGT